MARLEFLLPGTLNEQDLQLLQRAYVVSGTEYIPWPTQIVCKPGGLSASTQVNETGCLCVPWPVAQQGRLVLSTPNLMNRTAPYQLVLELARGKVNHVRGQAADWEAGGLYVSPQLREQLRCLFRTFAQAACNQEDSAQTSSLAQQAIEQAVQTGELLVESYVEQVFALRCSRQHPLPTTLACRVYALPASPQQTECFQQTFNAVQLPFHWPTIEPEEGDYRWDLADALISWAQALPLPALGGPVIDFSPEGLPGWLQRYRGDLRRISNYMEDYLEMVLQRYGDHIASWEVTAASNSPGVLGLTKEELLHLTNRLFDTAHQSRRDSFLVLGLAQPWGEYVAHGDHAYFPFLFADTLLRNRSAISALSLEILAGVSGRGSLSRDLLDLSRILDLYSLLGLPLRVTLGCPSAPGPDPLAQPHYSVEPRGAGVEWSPAEQARWATRYLAVAACKPNVEAVTWVQFADDQRHPFPHCGLVHGDGSPKPAADPIRRLRQRFLR
jgi:hypothetical protein